MSSMVLTRTDLSAASMADRDGPVDPPRFPLRPDQRKVKLALDDVLATMPDSRSVSDYESRLLPTDTDVE